MNQDKPFLSDEEIKNAKQNAEQLKEITDIFYSIIRLSALVPKALKDTDDRLTLGVFGMFLKTILADLRSVHVLTGVGYPFSAATVASSLWEKSVMGRFVLKSPSKRIQTYIAHPTKKRLPWDMKTMLAELVDEADITKRKQAVEIYYIRYTHLCSLKHPQAATISKASEYHFESTRPMELIPCSAESQKDFSFLILAQSIYSTLEFMKFAFPMFCNSELVNGCLHLCGKLGKHCWDEKPTLYIDHELQLPTADMSSNALAALSAFWNKK